MKCKHILLALAVGALGVAMVPTATAAAQFQQAERAIEGRYIVVLKDSAARLRTEPPGTSLSKAGTKPAVSVAAANIASQYKMKLESSYTDVLRGFVVSADARALKQLLQDERVAYVEQDAVVSLDATQSNATWGIDRVDQRNLPLDGKYSYDVTAASVSAYIIDTGIRATHSQFGNRVHAGYTAINDGRGTSDCNGHGTHVAGTVGGSTYGLAKSVQLYAVRVLDCGGTGSMSGIINGMDWVAQNHSGPSVANMSLGGGASTASDQAVASLRSAGVTVVVAAGNENQNACNTSPARSTAAITVGSTDSNDRRSSFSNWGSCVNIFAPGGNITSAWYSSDSAINTISGTSMASPHVAGGVALYLAQNPGATPTQVEQAIYANATPNKVTDPKGSSNRLLYTLSGGGGEPDPGTPDPGGSALSNGVAVTVPGVGSGNFSGDYTVAMPSGASNLKISISGGSGDADLYVKFGSEPTASSYDCRPYVNGSSEQCSFASPSTGTYHVKLRAYQSFSNVQLVATWDTAGGGDPDPGNPGGGQLANGVPVALPTITSGNFSADYTAAIPAGASNLRFAISGGTGDADLYVRFGAEPTTSTYDCRPYRAGNNEECVFATPSAGTYHVKVRAYQTAGNVQLVATWDSGSGGTPPPGNGQYDNPANITIPDGGSASSPISVSGQGSAGPASLKISVKITHAYSGDLRITIIAPSGASAVLKEPDYYDNTANVDTVYSVNASGVSPNGTWKLKVDDVYTGYTGYIDHFGLTF